MLPSSVGTGAVHQSRVRIKVALSGLSQSRALWHHFACISGNPYRHANTFGTYNPFKPISLRKYRRAITFSLINLIYVQVIYRLLQ